MGESSNIHKFLELKRILEESTDENHPLSVQELIEKLQYSSGTNEKIDKRRIKRYIDILDDSGFEIISNTEKYGKIFYSHQDRLFETYELRMLADAVLSASFVTEEQASHMIDKLKKLTSSHIAKTLPSPTKHNKAQNHIHHLTKVYIDKIHSAIKEKKVIQFKYGKYDIHRTFQFNRNGQEYLYHPYTLIWNQGFYYLIGQKENKEGLSNYRVDRMRDVEILGRTYKRVDYPINEYLRTTFHMFSGQGEWVEIKFGDANLINPVIDKFGLDANIKVLNENTFLLKTKVIVGEGFFNWVRGWGSKAQIVSPPALVQKMKEEIEKMNELYS